MPGRLVDDLHAAAANDVQGVGIVALAKQPFTGAERDLARSLRKRFARLGRERGEQRDGPEQLADRLRYGRRRGANGPVRRSAPARPPS